MRFAAPPDVLYWSPRSAEHGDCVIAAIELACGVTYEVALAACVEIKPSVLVNGMYDKETERAVCRLGLKCQRIRAGRFDLEDSTGILTVYQPNHYAKTSHAVYLWEGRIVEPMNMRRQLWLSPQAFLNHYKYRAGSLLIVQLKEEE